VAALPALTGCGLLDREKDGDKEPLALVEYVVTVNPQSRTLDLAQGPNVIPLSVEIAGKCVGELIPPKCETFKPFWSVYNASRGLSYGTTFDNRESPTTIAHMLFDKEDYFNGGIDRFSSSLMGNDVSTYVTFYTTRELRGVGHNLGQARFDLHFELPAPVPAQQEGSATEERVTVAQTPLIFELSRTQLSAEKSATIKYTGPATVLKIDGPYDSAGALTGSATKFIVLNPTTVETPLAANATKTLIVYFQVPLDDFNPYRAYLEIKPTNGDKVTVKLKGTRNPF
jgi:hypothetical protein